MIYFGEIVIFGGEPEDRNCVGAFLCDCVRPTESGDRFIDTVGGARKEADLLAGDDGDCSCGEAIEILGGFGRKLGAGGEARILFAQDFDDRAASFRVETDFFGGGENSRFRGRVAEVTLDAFEFFRESGEKLCGVRDFAKRQAVRFHGGGHDTRALLRQQCWWDGRQRRKLAEVASRRAIRRHGNPECGARKFCATGHRSEPSGQHLGANDLCSLFIR